MLKNGLIMDKCNNVTVNSLDKLGCLILDELKLIRSDMKAEMKQLSQKIELYLFEKEKNKNFISMTENMVALSNTIENQNVFLPFHELEKQMEQNDLSLPDISYHEEPAWSNLDQSLEKVDDKINRETTPVSSDIDSKEMQSKSVSTNVLTILENNQKSTEVVTEDDNNEASKNKTSPNSESSVTDMQNNCHYNLRMCTSDFKDDQDNNESDKNKVSSESVEFHRGKAKLKCRYCTQTFYNNITYQLHLNDHTDKKSDEERRKKKVDPQKTNKNFKKAHKSYLCTYCGRTFLYKTCLMTHKRKHIKKRKSSVYSKRLAEKRKTKQLSKVKFLTDKKPSSDLTNKKSFALNKSKKSFLVKRTPKKSYICPVCNRQFTYEKNWERHRKLHKKEKSYSCSKCDETFTSEQTLKSHMQLHTLKTMFSCKFCSKLFRYKRSLTSHLRLHNSQSLFSCSTCSKQFVYENSWTKHMKQHAGEKPTDV